MFGKPKARIIQKTSPVGDVSFTIQQKHFLFRWVWVDAWVNSLAGAACTDTWPTIEQARANLCYFDGTQTKRQVVH